MFSALTYGPYHTHNVSVLTDDWSDLHRVTGWQSAGEAYAREVRDYDSLEEARARDD